MSLVHTKLLVSKKLGPGLFCGYTELAMGKTTQKKKSKHNMERINRGANGRKPKQKVKGRDKGEDRSGKRKKGDKARNSDPIKWLKVLYFFTMLNLGNYYIIRHMQFRI